MRAFIATALLLGICAKTAAQNSDDPLGLWRSPDATSDALDDTHRELRASDIPALIAIARELPERRRQAIEILGILAWHNDAEREELATLFAAELAQRDAPTPPARPAGSGLPPHFETLARATWGLEGLDVYQREAVGIVPYGWLLRWAGETEPTLSDLVFLDEIVREADGVEHGWALRHRVRLSGTDAKTWLLARWADDDSDIDVAAHLALLGDREPWEEFVDYVREDDVRAVPATPLIWRVDPYLALASVESAPALTPDMAFEWKLGWDVVVSDAQRALIADRLRHVEGGLSKRIHFYARTFSDGLRGDAARSLAQELAAAPEASGGESLVDDDLVVVLGLLALREPALADTLLATWSARDDELRGFAFWARLRLGLAVEPDRAWESWMRPDTWGDRGRGWPDAQTIGLLRDDTIASRLTTLVEDRGDRASSALSALALRAGLPIAACALVAEVPPDDDVFAASRDAIVAGTPRVGLALLVEEWVDWAACFLPPERMRAIRAKPGTVGYWPATVGLALAGDAECIADVEALLRKNRTQVLDEFGDFVYFGPRGRRFARLHAARLGHNCCSRFQATVALRTLFPTLTVEDDWITIRQDIYVREWLEQHEDDLVWSRLASAWLPR